MILKQAASARNIYLCHEHKLGMISLLEINMTRNFIHALRFARFELEFKGGAA